MPKRVRLAMALALVAAAIVYFVLSTSNEPGQPPKVVSAEDAGGVAVDPPVPTLEASAVLDRAPAMPELDAGPGGAFEVTVERDGQRVRGATVRVFTRGERELALNAVGWQWLAQGTTAEKPLRLRAGTGQHFIDVELAGVRVAERFVTRQTDELVQAVRFELGELHPLEVVVKGAGGPANVSVLAAFDARAVVAMLPAQSARTAVTDANGSVTMRLPEGDFLVHASTSAVRTASAFVRIPRQSVVTLELKPVAMLVGRVVLPDAGPAVGATVTDWMESEFGLETRSGDDGTFELQAVAGLHVLGATQGTLSGTAGPIELAPAQRSAMQVIRLSESARLRGRVVEKRTGLPLQAVTVSVSPHEVTGEVARELTGLDGRWEAQVPLGAWDLDFSAKGFASEERRGVEVRRAVAVTIDMALEHTGQIEGRVLERDGSPVRDVEICFSWIEKKPRMALASDITAATGRFLLDGIPSGDGFLVVSLPTRTFSVPVTMPEGGRLKRDIIVPGEPKTLRGVIEGGGKLPAVVRAWSESRERSALGVSQFELELEEGVWEVQAFHHGQMSQKVEVKIGERTPEPIHLVIPGAKLRTVEVVDRRGKPVTAAVFCTREHAVRMFEDECEGTCEAPADVDECTANTPSAGARVQVAPGEEPVKLVLASASVAGELRRNGKRETAPCTVTASNAARGSTETRTVTGGTFRFEAVPVGVPITFDVDCPATTTRVLVAQPGENQLVVELDEMGWLEVTVENANGVPRVGLLVSTIARAGNTDRFGKVSFPVPPGPTQVFVQHPPTATVQTVEVRAGVLTSVQVLAP